MRGNPIAIKFNRAASCGKRGQKITIAACGYGNVGKQRQPRAHVGYSLGRTLGVGKHRLFAGVLDLLTGDTIKAGERSGGYGAHAELRIALQKRPLFGRPFVHLQSVEDGGCHQNADRDDGDREQAGAKRWRCLSGAPTSRTITKINAANAPANGAGNTSGVESSPFADALSAIDMGSSY